MSGDGILSQLCGHWTEEDAQNIKEFMKFLDINYESRAVGQIRFHEEWQVKDDQVTLILQTPFLKSTSFFKLGDEFQAETLDNKTAKTTYTEEGGALVCRQMREPEPMVYKREVNASEGTMKLTITIEAKDPVTATLILKRDP